MGEKEDMIRKKEKRKRSRKDKKKLGRGDNIKRPEKDKAEDRMRRFRGMEEGRRK